MKLTLKNILLGLCLAFIISCGDDEGTSEINPINVNFSTTSLSVSENGEANNVTILFGSVAPIEGSFQVEVSGSAVYGEDYTTSPDGSSGSVTIDVAIGDVSKAFSFTPINNSELDGERVATFKITNASEGIQLGSDIEFSVTITDDEQPASVSFSSSSLIIEENGGEDEVIISFSEAAMADGSITVGVAGSAVYSTNYTTDPVVSSESLTIEVKTGDTSKSIKLSTVDDNVQNPDRTVIFTITEATGSVELGDDLVNTITITDDDEDPLTIASLRTDFEANGSKSLTDGYIKGVVISEKSNINDFSGRSIVVQDNTDGIFIKLEASNTNFDLGDELIINLAGGTLEEVSGIVQVSGIALSVIEDLGAGTLPDPEVITPAELQTGNYQSRLVTVSDLAFWDVDGEETFDGNIFGFFNTKSNGFINSFFRSGSDFDGEVIPVGVGNMTGIATVISGGVGLLLRNLDDLDLTEIATLNLETDEGTDFGQVISGQYSDTKMYTLSLSSGTLQGFALLGFTGPPGTDILELSRNGSDFSNTVSATVEELTAGPVDIYVRLLPNFGENGIIENTLHIQSFGVASINQTLTVEEIVPE